MLRRKDYRCPTVESEEILEQASLACTVIWYSESDEPFTQACVEQYGVDVAKNGAFTDTDVYCTVWMDFPDDIVMLS